MRAKHKDSHKYIHLVLFIKVKKEMSRVSKSKELIKQNMAYLYTQTNSGLKYDNFNIVFFR